MLAVRVHLGVAERSAVPRPADNRRREKSAVHTSDSAVGQLRDPSAFTVQCRATVKTVQQPRPFRGVGIPTASRHPQRASSCTHSLAIHVAPRLLPKL